MSTRRHLGRIVHPSYKRKTNLEGVYQQRLPSWQPANHQVLLWNMPYSGTSFPEMSFYRIIAWDHAVGIEIGHTRLEAPK